NDHFLPGLDGVVLLKGVGEDADLAAVGKDVEEIQVAILLGRHANNDFLTGLVDTVRGIDTDVHLPGGVDDAHRLDRLERRFISRWLGGERENGEASECRGHQGAANSNHVTVLQICDRRQTGRGVPGPPAAREKPATLRTAMRDGLYSSNRPRPRVGTGRGNFFGVSFAGRTRGGRTRYFSHARLSISKKKS